MVPFVVLLQVKFNFADCIVIEGKVTGVSDRMACGGMVRYFFV
jgi:hypothetical protein